MAANGELEGAYRRNGKEWRIPQSALTALQQRERGKHRQSRRQGSPRTANGTTMDIGAWRDHLPSRRPA
jgi:hypothetical protein